MCKEYGMIDAWKIVTMLVQNKRKKRRKDGYLSYQYVSLKIKNKLLRCVELCAKECAVEYQGTEWKNLTETQMRK